MPNSVDRARRPADRAVVLGPAADVVERLRVVGGDPIVLRQRQVGEVPPRLHAVVGLVETAVVGEDDVILVRRIEHDVVVIDVHAGHRDLCPGRRRRCRDRRWSAATRWSPGRDRRRRSRCSSRDRRRGNSRRCAPPRPPSAASPDGLRRIRIDSPASCWRCPPPPPAAPPRPPPVILPICDQVAPASSDLKNPPCPSCEVPSA